MRNISAENLAALEARELVARDFIWFVVRDRATGAPVTDGVWSDVGNISAAVIHPDTGIPVTRDWYGSGTLVGVDDIPLVANLSAQNITIRMSQVSEHVQTLVRQYDCKQGRVEIYRGLFDPDTRQMVAAAECRFVGVLDQPVLKTPSENEVGSVIITCASHTQEMTRTNPATRSHATQILRQPGDGFFQDADTVTEWEFFWGSEKGVVPTQKKRKKFLGLF
jgi:hypothetical protein